MLEQLPPQFVEGEACGVAPQSLRSRPLDPTLHAPKDPLEKHRVRARVPAPQTALDGRHDQQREPNPTQEEEDEPEILSVEHSTEEIESTVHDVDEHRGVAANFHEG